MEIKTGQIVNIRKRLWRVDSIYENELLATSIDSVNNFQKNFFIPLEEIKAAQIDIPQFDKFGNLSNQQLLLNAYKISLIHGTSPLLSLQRSSVLPTNFQLVPVIMALNSPLVRLLIADDVGLGKTIEAGLIINELIARQTARKILVITPANLREQWQEDLRNFFKLDFKIISSIHKKYLEKELPIGISPWNYFQKLITSVDYSKRKANKNEILNYDWDLVVIDEAHLCARPHAVSLSQKAYMQRWQLISEIAKHTKHLLLLTATPHNGYTDSFASLLEPLRIEATSKEDLNFIDRKKARKHVCQRRRQDVLKWLEEDKDSRRDRQLLDNLIKYFGDIRLEDISAHDVEKYKAHRIRKIKKSTVNRELGCLKALYNKAIEWNYTEKNPVTRIKFFNEEPFKRQRYLSEEEIVRLLDACGTDYLCDIVEIALNTGMRQGSILNLKWKDIDFIEEFVIIKNTKNNNIHNVPMNKRVKKILFNRKCKKINNKYVFCHDDGTNIKSIRGGFDRAVEDAGIDDFRFHDLRHTFASNLVKNNVNLLVVKKLLDHSTISMTIRYSHLAPNDQREAV